MAAREDDDSAATWQLGDDTMTARADDDSAATWQLGDDTMAAREDDDRTTWRGDKATSTGTRRTTTWRRSHLDGDARTTTW
ncbi:MAG: hypothetical protein KIT84_16545 [Labilithrix sp.]|nr:hypothetical protein [Labilithrix sp.]MCW5812640.1 hypothetical protein [Labilithrix sp.]